MSGGHLSKVQVVYTKYCRRLAGAAVIKGAPPTHPRTYTPPAPQAQTQTQESALSSSPQDGRPIITSRDSSLHLPLFLCSFIFPINTPVGESAFCVYNATKCKLSGRSLHVSLVEVRAACMYYTIHPTGRPRSCQARLRRVTRHSSRAHAFDG